MKKVKLLLGILSLMVLGFSGNAQLSVINTTTDSWGVIVNDENFVIPAGSIGSPAIVSFPLAVPAGPCSGTDLGIERPGCGYRLGNYDYLEPGDPAYGVFQNISCAPNTSRLEGKIRAVDMNGCITEVELVFVP